MHCCRQVYLPNVASKLGIIRISGILFAGCSLAGESTGDAKSCFFFSSPLALRPIAERCPYVLPAVCSTRCSTRGVAPKGTLRF